MAEATCDIGLIGLAVMGQNLVLNMNDHGYKVAVYNRTTSKVDDFLVSRAELAANRVPRQGAEARMAALRARLQRDLARAQAVLNALESRTAQREAAVEAAAPGSRDAARRARAESGATRSVVAAATVPLRLRPEAGAPEIGRVAAGQAVTVRPAQSGFALVEGQGGLRGYAPTGAFQIAERTPAAAVPGRGGEVRQLVATNIARRDNFAESLSLAREAAVSRFELGA